MLQAEEFLKYGQIKKPPVKYTKIKKVYKHTKKKLVNIQDRTFVMDKMCKYICDMEGITVSEMKSESRERHICRSRQMVHYFAYELGVNTFSDIARYFSYNHATVMSSRLSIQGYMYNPDFKEQIESYRSDLLDIIHEFIQN